MLKQQLQIKLSQKLSPQQIQLMKMIQLSTLELEQKIEAEIGENPALEIGKQELANDSPELDDRNEKDVIQTLAQADALAVHLETGNLAAAKRLMRQLPELSQTFPNEYRDINLVEFKLWLTQMISIVPDVDNILQISNIKPPKLLNCRKK